MKGKVMKGFLAAMLTVALAACAGPSAKNDGRQFPDPPEGYASPAAQAAPVKRAGGDSQALQILKAAKLDDGVKDGRIPAGNPRAADAGFDLAIAGSAATAGVGSGALPGVGTGATIGISLLSAVANASFVVPIELDKYVFFVPRGAAANKDAAVDWAREVLVRAMRSALGGGYSIAVQERTKNEQVGVGANGRPITAFSGVYLSVTGPDCPPARRCELRALAWSDTSFVKPTVRKGKSPAFSGEMESWIVVFDQGFNFVPGPVNWPDDAVGRASLHQALARKIAGYLPANTYYLEGRCAKLCAQARAPQLINSEGSRYFVEGLGAIATPAG